MAYYNMARVARNPCQWVGVLNFTFSFHFQRIVCLDMQIFHMQEPVKEKIYNLELTLIL